MASPSLAFRLGVLGGLVFIGAAVVATFLGVLFIIGVSAIAPASLAIGVLLVISLFAAIALTFVLTVSLLVVGLIALALFVVVALVVSPPVAILVVLFFLVLLALVAAVVGNPLNIPVGLLVLAFLLLPIVAMLVGILGPGSILVVMSVLGFVALGLAVAWLLFNVHRMPIELLGLGGLSRMPAVPLPSVQDFVDAVYRLLRKEEQRQVAIDALTNAFTLGAGTARERTASARTYLFEEGEAGEYSLDLPSQFGLGWTTRTQIDERAAPLAPEFVAGLTTEAAGTAQFWLNISRYWGPFGIAPIRIVTDGDVPQFRTLLGADWDDATMLPLVARGSLFVIDMTIFAEMDPPTQELPLFTPATLAFFRLDTGPSNTTLRLDTTGAPMPAFTPFLIQVSDGTNTQVYRTTPPGSVTPNAWLYALQALKAATTVWGIWLGHVYRYHIVTAAMQMTMFQRLPPLHPVRQVLGFQSEHLIGFDAVLLVDWTFQPPTSAETAIQFLQLTDAFAANRPFFADDPETTLADLGLTMTTFSRHLFALADINLPAFAARLLAALATPGSDPVSDFVLGALAPATTTLLGAYVGGEDVALQAALVADLNAVVTAPGASLAGTPPFAGVTLSPDTSAEIAAPTPFAARINRMMLQDAYPSELWIMQWNLYPIAHYMVSIYRAAARYVGAVVATLYPTPASIAGDARLLAWINASATDGNVQGLPIPLTTPAQLTAVLTSLIYRITAHGLGRMAPVGNPGLSWIGNFPPCLEDSRIPDPLDPAGTGATVPPVDLTTEQLLAFLPKTETIGRMLSFIFTFGFTPPIDSLIPMESANTTGSTDVELHPFTGLPAACDTALQTFRAEISGFIRYLMADMNDLNRPAAMNFSATTAATHQWPRNIEI